MKDDRHSQYISEITDCQRPSLEEEDLRQRLR